MKLTKLFQLLTFVFLISNFSCQKDDSPLGNNNPQENIPNTFSEYFGNEISRDFLGTVVDKNHNPIEGANITIGNKTASTDSNGIFIIRDANVNERFGYVKAEKEGYIHASRSVVPSNGTNKVTIMMLEEMVVGTVSSGSTSTVTIDGGSSVSFDGNFIKEDGTAYEGSVDVIMHHLDPTDEDMSMQMPGMLYAENEDGAERMLQTLGMLAVELRGSSGEDLNLPEGSTSEIKIPVDTSLMSIAPATIPLWYFDEATGYWKEDGEATLQGNMYVGTVSHFSFWTCSIFHLQHNTLSIFVEDVDGNPLNNVKVALSSENLQTIYDYTNNSGVSSGLVPSNRTIELDLSLNYLCEGNSIFNQIIGPFNSDTTINIVIPEYNGLYTEHVHGNFHECNGQQINEGYIFITHGSKVFIDVVSNSSFNTNLLRCNENILFGIEAVDLNTYNSSGKINYSFTSPSTFVGDIYACNEIDEFIQFSVNNSEGIMITNGFYSRFVENYQPYDFEPMLQINGNENSNSFHIQGILSNESFIGSYGFSSNNSVTPGFFSEASVNGNTYYNYHDNYDVDQSFYDNQYFNLNELGGIGEYIDMNFQFNAIDTQSNSYVIKGIIHVIRDN